MIIVHDKHEETRPMIRAVIYIRFSSKMQAESYSIEYQQEECLKHIERKGYKFIKAYIDEAKTGKRKAGREALEEMLYDAGRDKFDRIIVFSFSRSFRNTRDALNTNHELKEKHGITIESVIEPIDLSSPHGKFSGTNLFAMHELQSDITAAHVRSGMYIAAKQGYYLGASVPFGYDVYDTGEFTRGKPRKRYCINEEEAEYVRLVFKMYNEGYSQKYIRDELLKRGVVNKNGKSITSNFIYRMLRYEFYIGTRTYNVKGYEPLIIKNAVPAIIDEKTFNEAQLKNAENQKYARPRQTKRFYPLTGKIECSTCGKHYVGSHSNAPKHYIGHEGYTNYICYTKKQYGTCTGRNIRKDTLEEYCIKQIKQHILTPEKIKEIAAFIMSQTSGTPDFVKEDFDITENRKRKVMDNIKNLKRQQLEADEAEQEINAELIAEYSKELQMLNEKIARLTTLEQIAISEETIIDFLNDCALNINSPDPHVLKTVFDKLIEKIVLYDDKVELFLIVFPFPRFALNDSQGSPHYSLSTNLDRKTFTPSGWKRHK